MQQSAAGIHKAVFFASDCADDFASDCLFHQLLAMKSLRKG